MKRVIFTALLVYMAALTSCQSDSDYLVGSYEVITTVKSSSCPANPSWFPENAVLPTGFLSEQTRHMHWTVSRIGITGTGTNKLNLVLSAVDTPDIVIVLSGSMENGIVRIENHDDISEEWYRFILLYGLIDGDHFIGEIRTLLSNIRNSSSFPSIAPNAPCEIHEEFVGKQCQSS